MKTISVREAAAALGLTPRAVTYRLDKGQLKGILGKNETTGVPEWRVYPNKEILAGLNASSIPQTSFEPDDVVIEAESVESTGERITEEKQNFSSDFQSVIEQCVRPLVEEVKAQALALAEKDRIIEEQNRQLRLLPDFQKQAEEERKAAELKELEARALRKQIAAIESEKDQAEALRSAAEEEIQRLKVEKDAQVTAVQEQLQALSATVRELQKPKPSWWQKLFSTPTTET